MATLANFQQKVLPKVEEVMIEFVQNSTNDEELKKSMLYSIQAGGKRIRPLLLLATVATFGELHQGAFQVAAALEMIHTYSLIHDDLPAMDDDDLRRGKPTNHKVFGEAMAILVGDGLLTGAFELLSKADVPPADKVYLFQLLSKSAGTNGMVAGQAADMQAEGKQVSLDELIKIHQRKTGALIRFATVAGGVLGNKAAIEELDQLAQHLGLAFQIRDDLLDVVGTTEELGKVTNRDQLLEKSTYPNLLGVDGAKASLADELSAAHQILEKISDLPATDTQLLKELCQLFEL